MKILVKSACLVNGQHVDAGTVLDVDNQLGRALLSSGRCVKAETILTEPAPKAPAPEAPAPEAPAPEAPAPEAPSPTFAPVDMTEPRGGRRRRKD